LGNTILKVENVSKRFPGVVALDNVSFDLRKGEVHALVGENGAGKSTLMKILTGVYQLDEGRITYKDKKIHFTTPHEAIQKGISIIYQELNLLPYLTVAQNIFIGREPVRYGVVIDRIKMNREAAKLLSMLHIDINPDTILRNLSVSKKQMVEIVKALSFQSEILIMDEPTSALSESEIDELFKIIHRLQKEGVSVIYISHRLEELARIVDRITVMRDGKQVGTYDYADITMDEIIHLMVGRTLDIKFPKRIAVKGEKILEVQHLTVKGVLHDISFDLKKGEILGIAGLMGAGRTELARAIFGADKIDAGKILINGREVAIKTPLDAIKSGIGYITEDRKIDGLALELPVDTNIVLSNIDAVSNFIGITQKGKKRSLAQKYIDDLHIKTPSLAQLVTNLSGGNQQKVVLAKWLCRSSKILILDEPTRGIDVGAKYEIYELINSMAAEGVGIIMISSELPEIIGLSDRILVLHEGTLTGALDRGEATQEKILNLATGLHNNTTR
jgi:ribose transport system ATP-binding protein